MVFFDVWWCYFAQAYLYQVYFFFVFHQDEMTFILANRVEDVLRAAFDDEFPGMAQATSSKL